MRLSTRRNDPGYCRVSPGAVRVLLDGAEVRECVTADEELGLALCIKRDAAGHVLLNHRKTGVQLVARRGVVRIELLRPDAIGMPASDCLNHPLQMRRPAAEHERHA